MSEFMAFLMSYETLRAIWWLFLCVLLIGFAITGGGDLGVGALLPAIARTDAERRVLINVIGPTWEGNQVWLVLGAGAIFAAYPPIYAAAFSGFYFAMILALFALILRPVGFKYRSKLEDTRWRAAWDWGLFVGGLVPALIFGVAVGNLLLGVPFRYDADLRVFYEGGLLGLLNPFGLLVGMVSLAMLSMQGAVYLQLKTRDTLRARSARWVVRAALALVATFVLTGLWVAWGVEGYRLASFAGTEAASNPTSKTVVREAGAWLANYRAQPFLWGVPIAAIAGALLTALLSRLDRPGLGFVTSSLTQAAVILTAGVAMFPFLMPSSLNPAHSLTAWDATSSLLTLRWMFWMVVIFLPLILFYTSWVFAKLRGPVTVEQVTGGHGHMY